MRARGRFRARARSRPSPHRCRCQTAAQIEVDTRRTPCARQGCAHRRESNHRDRAGRVPIDRAQECCGACLFRQVAPKRKMAPGFDKAPSLPARQAVANDHSAHRFATRAAPAKSIRASRSTSGPCRSRSTPRPAAYPACRGGPVGARLRSKRLRRCGGSRRAGRRSCRCVPCAPASPHSAATFRSHADQSRCMRQLPATNRQYRVQRECRRGRSDRRQHGKTTENRTK